MAFRMFGFCFLLISTLSYAQGRKPAVEDFVGIEVEEAHVTPRGSEVLFNLEHDIHKIESQNMKIVEVPKSSISTESTESPLSSVMAVSIVLGLPLMIWFLIMSHLKKKASVESASNLEVLAKYRKERERKSKESIRKVS